MCKSFCSREIPRTQAVSILLASRRSHPGCEGCWEQEFTAAGHHAAYCLWIWHNLGNLGHKSHMLRAEVILCFWSTLTLLLYPLGLFRVSYSSSSKTSQFSPSSSQSQSLPCSQAQRARLEGEWGAGRDETGTRLTYLPTGGDWQEQSQPECFWKLPAASHFSPETKLSLLSGGGNSSWGSFCSGWGKLEAM